MLSESDIEVQWFSGTGKGGQHRNKHQNCCRLIHKPTGIRCVGTGNRERSSNLRVAMANLERLVAQFNEKPKERRFADEVVRTYHFERGEVIDHSTGLRLPVKRVLDGDIAAFVETPARDGERQRSGRA